MQGGSSGGQRPRRPRSHRAGGGGDPAGERDHGPRARLGLGRQKWDWSEVERCQGGNSRHPSGRQVREGSASGLPLGRSVRRAPRCPPGPGAQDASPPAFWGVARVSLSALRITPSSLAFSDLLNPPLRRLWLGGGAIPPSLPSLNFFPPTLHPTPNFLSQSVSCFLGQSWAEDLGCGVADSPSTPSSLCVVSARTPGLEGQRFSLPGVGALKCPSASPAQARAAGWLWGEHWELSFDRQGGKKPLQETHEPFEYVC